MYQNFRKFLYNHGYMNSPIQKLWILFQKPFLGLIERKKINYVHKKGELLIKDFTFLANKLNIHCWLEFGTLLGAYRDKSFISFDYDIDMGMNYQDYTQEFQEQMCRHGFRKVKCFYLVDEERKIKTMTEVTYKYKGIAFDLFLTENTEESRYVYVYTTCIDDRDSMFNVRRYTLPATSEKFKVYINGIECMAPSNPYNYLSSVYGDDFMTPIQGWTPSKKKNPIRTMLDNNKFYGLLYRF